MSKQKLKDRMKQKGNLTTTSIQIDNELHKKVKAKLKQEGYSLHSLVEAAMRQYLEE